MAVKLTWDDVRAIRNLAAKGTTSRKQIADLYGVTYLTVSSIVNNKSWVEEDEQPVKPAKENATKPKLADGTVATVVSVSEESFVLSQRRGILLKIKAKPYIPNDPNFYAVVNLLKRYREKKRARYWPKDDCSPGGWVCTAHVAWELTSKIEGLETWLVERGMPKPEGPENMIVEGVKAGDNVLPMLLDKPVDISVMPGNIAVNVDDGDISI